MPIVFAVVPTYGPDPGVIGRLEALGSQVDRVIVVDDGSSAAETVLTAVGEAGFDLHRLPANRGIAAALNAGVRIALEHHADYVLTTDQDSMLPPGYVAACLAAFDSTVAATRLGIVLSDRVNGEPSLPARRSPEGLGLVDEGIQSGAVFSAEVLRAVGLFDERLVIDCVDTEYFIRAGEHGFRIAVAPGTDISHALGEMVPFRPFGIARRNRTGSHEYQYHSPFRQYYITRNNIDLVFRFFRRHRRWTLAVVKRQIGPTIDAVVSGPHRAKHLAAIVVGGVHGLVRRRGMIPRWLRHLVT